MTKERRTSQGDEDAPAGKKGKSKTTFKASIDLGNVGHPSSSPGIEGQIVETMQVGTLTVSSELSAQLRALAESIQNLDNTLKGQVGSLIKPSARELTEANQELVTNALLYSTEIVESAKKVSVTYFLSLCFFTSITLIGFV